MQIQIQVVSVDVTTKPTKNGSYQQATLAFRDIQQNKLKEKKVMSFTAEGKTLFSTVAQAQKDQTYTIDMEKEGEYWVWQKMEQSIPDTKAGTTAKGGIFASGPAAGGRTYETAEERAERQVLIVRQSSLSAAVATLAVGNKQVDPSAVLELAERYTGFVFQKAAANTMFSTELVDIPDDI